MSRFCLVVALLCFGSQAYAQADPMTFKPNLKDPCKSANTDVDECFINVVVTETILGGVRDCLVTLKDPDEQDLVDIRKGRRVTIVWRIDSSSTTGYRFTSAGIEFLNNDPPRQFIRPELSSDGQWYSWINRNGRRKVYEYVINAMSADRTVRCDLHPWIRNR
jgi:hypothetical protein